jgi:hypothetical protein
MNEFFLQKWGAFSRNLQKLKRCHLGNAKSKWAMRKRNNSGE